MWIIRSVVSTFVHLAPKSFEKWGAQWHSIIYQLLRNKNLHLNYVTVSILVSCFEIYVYLFVHCNTNISQFGQNSNHYIH